MILSEYKHKKKIKVVLQEGDELLKLLQNMEAQLKPYKKFTAAKVVLNSIQQNEVFLRLTLKKLREENNE